VVTEWYICSPTDACARGESAGAQLITTTYFNCKLRILHPAIQTCISHGERGVQAAFDIPRLEQTLKSTFFG
jgi:hypothetical protein